MILLTQTSLYSRRSWQEAENCGSKKKRDCTIREAKTKAQISSAVIVKLIFAFVFALCRLLVSHDAAHKK